MSQDLNLGPTDYESSRKGVIQSTPVQSQAGHNGRRTRRPLCQWLRTTEG